MSKPIYVLNGPNLNLLGSREPEVYGHETLDELHQRCGQKAKTLGHSVEFRQSNHEGELALLDALLACPVPIVEVHLSNIFTREEFRHRSYVSKAAKGVICGFGGLGYELAIEALAATTSPGTAG